jgi:type IX secretion system PorP/SprF family membrane protein
MKKFYFFIFLFVVSAAANAQDIHFSQFFNTPLALNPSLTGFTAGTYRGAVSYRNQWFTATQLGFGKSPYMTTAFTFDMPIKIREDALGVGVFVANDQAGANTFSTVIANASVSYIKLLGKKKSHRLAAGFQGGYTFQTIKVENFQFASQYTDNVFTPSMSTNENIGKSNVGYLNLNAGLFWYGRFNDYVSMYAGGSAFNVTMPKYDILPNQKRDLYLRWNVHSGIDVFWGKKYHMLPSAMFMRQGVNTQFNSGLGFGVDFKEDMKFTMGVYNRIHRLTSGVTTDAVIPYTAIDIKGFRVGMSYDVTISKLKQSGSAVGGIEFSITYTGKKRNYYSRHQPLVPRF